MQSNDSTTPAFPAFPCTSRYVALGAIEEAVSRVSRAIDAREAAALVIGPPGTGKSLLCGLITKQYQPSHQVVVLGETPLDDRDALLRHLLHRLGVDTRSSQSGDPHLALVDYINEQTDSKGLIIIVDEAQKLSADLIESIRMVTNITIEGQPRVFALLCGGVKLDETLVDSSLESFTQRASTRCYLHPMNGEETRYFIHETIRNCGAEPEATITDEAIAAIHHACCGVPRLINQVISQAIDCAADADETLITESFVDQAWSELQQLPSPMIEEPQIETQASTVEFGELGDSSATVQWSDEPAEKATERKVSREEVEPTAQAAGLERSAVAVSGPEPSACGSGVQTDSSAKYEARPSQSATCESNDGIHLESSSAVWVDDPIQEQPEPLFGQFDDEEEISVGSGFAAPAPTQASAPANLETLLQQEIVGAGDLVQANDSDCSVIQMHGEQECGQELEQTRDDSDLLVIEDEVAVIPIDAGNPLDNEPQSVSVDFQAMLSKMRGES